jgi:DNA-binding NtrC family response regulator
VLIVDDERLLAEALCDVLSDDHDVELATTVGAAKRMLRASATFDVVLCDVNLPDGTAADVFHGYRDAYPGRERRIVFATGGTDDPAIASIVSTHGCRIVKKPFDLVALSRLIDDVAAQS